jgi:hypothetical protein
MALGTIIGAVGIGLDLFGSSKASSAAEAEARQAEENARLTQEMADYNASISDGKARQAVENAMYDASFAEMEMMADIWTMKYQAETVRNQAIYEEEMATLIVEDGAVNQIRKRKQDLKDIASIEAAAAGAGAVASGTVLEVMAETVKNMEIDALEIGRLSRIEANKRMQNAYAMRTEADLLERRADFRELFGEMQQEGIMREGELLSKDYKDESRRLRKYGRIDASNYMAAAKSTRATASARKFGSYATAATNIYSLAKNL